jgi:hypothetical protein
MKFLCILKTVLALPGNSWSHPAAELEHLAESAAMSHGSMQSLALTEQAHTPGLLSSLRSGATMVINKFRGNELEEISEIVKTIPLYENVAFPFNQIDSEYWEEFVGISIRMNQWLKKLIPEKEALLHFDPDGEEATQLLGYLVQYVKESQMDEFGRVRKSTRKNANDALATLISFQNEYALRVGGFSSKWELSPYARYRLEEMIKKDWQNNF